MTEHIPMKRWGKDHWSMFAYIETLNVDGSIRGRPETLRMRIDKDRHPELWGSNNGKAWGRADTGQKYPTRCKDGEVPDHDDMDCAEDLEREGLIEIKGTGLNPLFLMTDKGWAYAGALRKHKGNGGVFHNFQPVEV